mmetsp:Transcript_70162/g.205702  ORF Transcript_70162/g.205702 Transcript_70162/m.205702 type:complete len:280 (-) Transcript_70162:691-1530(-)
MPGRGHLDHHAAEAPDVAPSTVAGLLDDLRRHPRDGPPEALRHGVGGPFRAAEVGELHVAVEADEDVRTLDVPVQHDGAAGVEVRQPLQQLAGVGGHEALVEGAELREHLGDRAPRHVLQVDVQAGVDVVVAHVAHDVGVLQFLADADLVLQGLAELPLRVDLRVHADFLDGEHLARPLVHGLEDAAQRTVAEDLAARPGHDRAPHSARGAQRVPEAQARCRLDRRLARHAEGRDALGATGAGEVRGAAPRAVALGLGEALLRVPRVVPLDLVQGDLRF